MISSCSPLVSFAGAVLSLCLCAGTTSYAASPVLPDTGPSPIGSSPLSPAEKVAIPGPLRSFLRMAGISQEIPTDQVLPMLARNTYLLGYNESTQTEFLRLLNRYLHQAKELQILAGANGTIQIANCADSATLLRVLGYRLRQGCGQKDVLLETANPTRAFLTIDSGFPLIELEEALQKDAPFTYTYPVSWVPLIYRQSDWLSLSANQKQSFGSVVDLLANDRMVARLYWALSKNDSETRSALQRSPGLNKLLPLAATLDFYGNQISIRSGQVMVPGGASAEAGWKELVGASEDNPGEFVAHLLEKDNGWLAAYFDSLSRTSQEQQAHLTESQHLKPVYEAFRSPGTDTPAAVGVLPKAPDLLVLFTRLRWEPSGEIVVPGGLDAWKQILNDKGGDSRFSKTLAKRARGWNRPEELLEGLAGLARTETDSGPLQMYMTLAELDSGRAAQQHLSADTVRLLANHFSQLSNWYLIFAEFPSLNDEAITRFVTVADSIDKLSDQSVRGNAMGTFQANVGLWQILARQGEIPAGQLGSSWQGVIGPFAKITTSAQLFDCARGSFESLLQTVTGKPGASQDEVVDLLAGPRQQSPEGQKVHTALAGRIRAVLNDQRLVSLDTLFALSDGLDEMAQGHPANDRLLPLAEELRDFDLPRQIYIKSEKIDWAPRMNSGHHAELQTKIDLTKLIKVHGTRVQLEAGRGQLTPMLRDALVGLNYAYFEPPGAQILHINPLFVRSHDFLGVTVTGSERLWQPPMLMGAGISAGGGAYLMGSLSDLPYTLATAEQDMIAPEHIQALIWKELAPELLSDSVMARWWDVTPNELHAVALYQKFGEELLIASVKSARLRGEVTGILADRMDPQSLEEIELALQRPDDTVAMLPKMLPADTFYLGEEFQKRFAAEASSLGQTGGQLEDLLQRYPTEVSWERLSRDFGIPHPTLARTNGRELLNVKPFPFYGAYSSRLFGERWESGNLYWARLADEMGYSPVMLNRLVPELTRHMIAKIFATNLEDWPAVLRAMQSTGEEFRQGKIVLLPAANTSASIARTVANGNAQ